MRNLLLFSLFAISLSVAVSCKKDNTTTNPTNNNNNNNTPTACNGKNLCFKMDGTEVSKDAILREIKDPSTGNITRNRVYWEDAASGSNIEIDVYGTATGSYTVAASPATGQAGFQYYLKENGTTKNIQGTSGTIEITALANGKISGKFTVTASDGITTYQVTDGNIVDVAK